MRVVVYLFAAVWLACVVLSLLAINAPPQGDSFLRGFNRIEGFLTWQFAALGAAIVAAIAVRLSRQPRSGPLKLLGYGPIVLSALLALIVAGIIAWAAFSPPPPVAPADVPGPATEVPS